MAEEFRGYGYSVYLSTGATYELYRSLIALGQREPATPPMQATLRFLERKIEGGEAATRGFDLAPPPGDIEDSARLACLGRLLAGFAHKLAATFSGGADDDPQSEQLRFDLLARVLDLRLLVLEAGAETAIAPEPDLPLTESGRREVELRRLLGRKEHLVRETRSDENPRGDVRLVPPDRLLPLLDRIIDLADALAPEARRRRILADQHFDQGTALAGRGDRAGAARAFRRAAELETDDELRASMLAYASDLET